MLQGIRLQARAVVIERCPCNGGGSQHIFENLRNTSLFLNLIGKIE